MKVASSLTEVHWKMFFTTRLSHGARLMPSSQILLPILMAASTVVSLMGCARTRPLLPTTDADFRRQVLTWIRAGDDVDYASRALDEHGFQFQRKDESEKVIWYVRRDSLDPLVSARYVVGLKYEGITVGDIETSVGMIGP